jgi:hypothetical protein
VQAKLHLKLYADTAPGLGTDGDISLNDSDLLSKPPPDSGSSQSLLVRPAIKRELLRKANDAFLECTPEQVPHIFDMVLFASGVPAAQRSLELEVMFKKSLDVELDRRWQSACQTADGSNSEPLPTWRRSNMSEFLLTIEVRHKRNVHKPLSMAAPCALLYKDLSHEYIHLHMHADVALRT